MKKLLEIDAKKYFLLEANENDESLRKEFHFFDYPSIPFIFIIY